MRKQKIYYDTQLDKLVLVRPPRRGEVVPKFLVETEYEMSRGFYLVMTYVSVQRFMMSKFFERYRYVGNF